jgi:hypothetical protein
MDPDTAALGTLEPLERWLDEHDILLTRTCIDPNRRPCGDPGQRPVGLAHRHLQPGLRGHPHDGEGARFARWWNDRLLDYCYDDMPNGMFVDQRWCDHVPALFDRVKIIRDPGYNVASWNLSTRTVTVEKDGRITVNGAPLRFWHFTKLGPLGDTMTRRYAGRNFPVYEIWSWYKRLVTRPPTRRSPSAGGRSRLRGRAAYRQERAGALSRADRPATGLPQPLRLRARQLPRMARTRRRLTPGGDAPAPSADDARRAVDKATRVALKAARLTRDFAGAHRLAHQAQVREALTRSELTLALNETLAARAELAGRVREQALAGYLARGGADRLRRHNRISQALDRLLVRLGSFGQALVIARSGVWRGTGRPLFDLRHMAAYARRGADPGVAPPPCSTRPGGWPQPRPRGRPLAPLVHYLVAGAARAAPASAVRRGLVRPRERPRAGRHRPVGPGALRAGRRARGRSRIRCSTWPTTWPRARPGAGRGSAVALPARGRPLGLSPHPAVRSRLVRGRRRRRPAAPPGPLPAGRRAAA